MTSSATNVDNDGTRKECSPKKHVGKVIESASIEKSVRNILVALGEEPDREGLRATPKRVAGMYSELLAGYQTDPEALINGAFFRVACEEMIVVRDIEFFSLCEHHMLPFTGLAHVAYIPTDRIIGLSKIPRIVEMFSRRLQVQERMTCQIGEFLHETLQTRGVAVFVEGTHLCAQMRGVKSNGSRMITSAMLGVFQTNRDARQEFFTRLATGAKSV